MMECATGLADDEFDELLAWLREEGVEGYPPILGLSGSLWAALMYIRQNIVQAVIGEQLPDSHPSKKVALDFVQKYEKAHGAGSRNQFAGHAYDAALVLEKVVPVALKKGKPGTPEFRAALKDAVETMGRTVVSHGVLNYAKDNHWGFTTETGVILKVVNGDWKVE